MPEPLKYLYNKHLIQSVANEIKKHYELFDIISFTKTIFDDHWNAKELKERMRHISTTMHSFLPQNYEKSLDILMAVSSKFNGFEYMFFQDFVEVYGLEEYKISMPALAHFTQFASSEFAVRPFIIKYPEKMMKQMTAWSLSENYHIRRLASEGCRPRLPWAMALPVFKKDPSKILPILENLKNDESEYVRRSVANNLNDIAKDNPHIVKNIAKKWFGQTSTLNKLVKHACRTLLKQGDSETLILFGFAEPAHIQIKNFIVQKSVKTEERLTFSFTLLTTQKTLGKLRIEYNINFMKANGKQAAKIFKISEADFSIKEKNVKKEHSFKYISTRKYYPGKHGLEIIINGQKFAEDSFELTM